MLGQKSGLSPTQSPGLKIVSCHNAIIFLQLKWLQLCVPRPSVFPPRYVCRCLTHIHMISLQYENPVLPTICKCQLYSKSLLDAQSKPSSFLFCPINRDLHGNLALQSLSVLAAPQRKQGLRFYKHLAIACSLSNCTMPLQASCDCLQTCQSCNAIAKIM